MGDLSPHFDSSEFADKRTGETHAIDPALVAVLERIRSITGTPLEVISGFRSAATNEAVGGAANSQHLYGRAADIPSHRATLDQAVELGARGVGTSDGWAIHVDTRPGAVATWEY